MQNLLMTQEELQISDTLHYNQNILYIEGLKIEGVRGLELLIGGEVSAHRGYLFCTLHKRFLLC